MKRKYYTGEIPYLKSPPDLLTTDFKIQKSFKTWFIIIPVT